MNMRIPEEYTRKSMAEILVIDDDIKESRQIKTFLSTEKKYGVTLFRPVLEKEKYPDKTFDVVIFSDSMKETVGRLIRNEHFELSPEILADSLEKLLLIDGYSAV